MELTEMLRELDFPEDRLAESGYLEESGWE
jgi:hypothetical protein